ncbi:RSP_7527 family protein [Reinekea sp. G2M2-21]|uniref:RSP_7527 family protein n=1 Tax=Reinekea sp. G2M2-21 TaxID=2788942 RepID=UPI0018AA9F3A|nr:hypothetical protein [Reinekea sp. G2M2-21]
MQSFEQIAVNAYEPSDVERHIQRARAMRSQAVNDATKAAFEWVSRTSRSLLTASPRARKA